MHGELRRGRLELTLGVVPTEAHLPRDGVGVALAQGDRIATNLAMLACAGPLIARLVQAVCSREPIRSVILNPFAVLLLLVLQWLALARKKAGRAETWRGRSYPLKG